MRDGSEKPAAVAAAAAGAWEREAGRARVEEVPGPRRPPGHRKGRVYWVRTVSPFAPGTEAEMAPLSFQVGPEVPQCTKPTSVAPSRTPPPPRAGEVEREGLLEGPQLQGEAGPQFLSPCAAFPAELLPPLLE